MSREELYANAKDAIAEVFGRHVGRNKDITYSVLAAKTGIPKASLYKVSDGANLPNIADWLLIADNLPLASANEVTRLLGMELRRVAGEQVCDHELLADLTEAASVVGQALKDKYVDHLERPDVDAAVRAIHEITTKYLAGSPKKNTATLEVVGSCNDKDKPRGAA